MFSDRTEDKGRTIKSPANAKTEKRPVGMGRHPERRFGQDRRVTRDRRIAQRPFEGPDRRSGRDRRKTPERRKQPSGLRIPIFVKLAAMSALLIFLVIFVISYSMLNRQKNQFVGQLINLGESMIRMAANNAPDKLLEGDELALFQLVNDIAENDQVLYASITDHKGIIRAHSQIEKLNEVYSPPEHLTPIEEINAVKVSSFIQGHREELLFEKPILYQKLQIGTVRIAISQEAILRSIRGATMSVLVLTVIILLVGILLSLGLSMYFARPIFALRESAKAIGTGNFRHRVHINRNDELGDLGSTFNRMAEGLADREMIRETFGKYVSPQIRDEILSGRIPLDGERLVATLLFADLRDFTPYVEQHSPEEVVKGLRAYFTGMQKAISRHDGLVLQYVGDEIEAVFGAPLRYEDHAEKAVKAALEMRKGLEELNKARIAEGATPFAHGIGIFTGEVLAGNTGSEDRLSYTFIGDTVNLTARIQALTKDVDCDILASEETVKRLKGSFGLKKEAPHMVKGYSRPVTVYQVLS